MYMLNQESRVDSGKVCVNGKAGRMRMQFSLFLYEEAEEGNGKRFVILEQNGYTCH